MKKILIIIVLIIFLTGCKERIYEEENVNYFNIIEDELEVYDDVKISDIVENKSKYKILNNDELLDTSKIGNNEYQLYYRKNFRKYVYKFSLDVKDTLPPVVFSSTYKTVNIHYSKDLCDLITYGDNYTGDVKCEIKGSYDLDKAGKYTLTYLLSDSSNNIKEQEVNITVVDPNAKKEDKKEDNSNNDEVEEVEPPKFSDYIKKYKKGNSEIGIDVSKWQGDIDFKKVKKEGASFVIMRIGVQADVKEEATIDSYFKENIKKAKKDGLKVGVYFNTIATSSAEAKEQALWVIDTLDGEKLDLPIAIDWENWSKWNSLKISFHEVNSIADTFMNTIKENGYDGMLYSSKFYLERIWDNKFNYPVWLAHYTDETDYNGSYMLWQFCNDGIIDGINGNVDLDILYK